MMGGMKSTEMLINALNNKGDSLSIGAAARLELLRENIKNQKDRIAALAEERDAEERKTRDQARQIEHLHREINSLRSGILADLA